MSPNIQYKPLLKQLQAIISCPITCYLGEQSDPHLATTSFQVAVESNNVTPELPFLQVKHPTSFSCSSPDSCSRPLPNSIALFLDMLQPLNVLVVRGPELDTGFEVWPHQCPAQGDNRCPGPAGHTIADTGQVPLASWECLAHVHQPQPIDPAYPDPPAEPSCPEKINSPAQLGIICKLTESALVPFFQIVDKDIKQDWSQY
ncbi:hypothetical protein HGM15179_008589 [Zosterops borbonicus]|uniref:Uncharacterized protein n=1 Tax=Zosterops borbonicus TaxID=364589 RepID=A0A8K1GIU7_9PASS|nr:hypothetical protein HGM15179_008589 [Zosterops borbonicus]